MFSYGLSFDDSDWVQDSWFYEFISVQIHMAVNTTKFLIVF